VIRQFVAPALAQSFGAGVFVRAQLVGAAIPSVTPAGDHPSNGVVESIITPALGGCDRAVTDLSEVYAPWDGFLSVSVKNISLGVCRR
jgi:hypothetical protein